jgi:hypothetical protein
VDGREGLSELLVLGAQLTDAIVDEREALAQGVVAGADGGFPGGFRHQPVAFELGNKLRCQYAVTVLISGG